MNEQNILKFCEVSRNSIFEQMLKVSALYLEKQKSSIPEKKNVLAVVNIKTKKLCLLSQFSVTVLE